MGSFLGLEKSKVVCFLEAKGTVGAKEPTGYRRRVPQFRRSQLPSVLPTILQRAGDLPAVHPTDGDPIEHGHIYVAPPDHHLLVEDSSVRLVRGPRENGHRPAID